MKIIGVDNYAREDKSDGLVAENVSEFHGKIMVEALNAKLCRGDSDPIFYKLVPDDHKLYTFEP